MSFDLVLDHITSIKKDTDYINTVLQDHLPKRDPSSGRAIIALSSFELEQSERDEIIEITESIVTRVSEINQELNDPSWQQYTQNPVELSQQLYSTALGLNQEQMPDDALLFEPLSKFVNSINGLERAVKVTHAMNKGNTFQKKYSSTQVNAHVNELEKGKREIRLKIYNKIDSDLKKLSDNFEHQNHTVLDKAVEKLLHLIGFDTEIYDPEIPGNIDVIAIDSREEIVCICENTTGQLSKKKVDQIVGRKTEYEGEYKTWKNVKVYPVLVSTYQTVFTDNLARRECVLNGVSVLAKKELDELVKNVKKRKMSPSLFVEYIKKKVPKK